MAKSSLLRAYLADIAEVDALYGEAIDRLRDIAKSLLELSGTRDLFRARRAAIEGMLAKRESESN